MSPEGTEPVTITPSACIEESDWLDCVCGLARASVDFVYADPPFNTGVRKRGEAGSYDDAWATIDDWLGWLGERLTATVPAVKATGLILLHLDWRTSHRARVMLDDLLGAECFVNHLIWSYGLGGSSPRRFARKHDDLLLYCVDPQRYWFEPPMVPATSVRLAGKLKKATDVLDIPALNNMAKERTGYPTQKPLALLELLIGACCPPGGVVLDPCCGSGTTLVAARRTGRVGIGCDSNPGAIEIARQRVADAAERA